MAIQKNVTINRKEYEKIKKYDRTQMDTFIQSFIKVVLKPVQSQYRG